MSDVPDELLREILSRLPVAPLLRFRSVSKSWKGLIDSDEFMRHHLNHSRKSNSNLNMVLRSLPLLYSTDFDLLNETNMPNFKQLSHPLSSPSLVTDIWGSCDGLLVLRNNKDDITILWNLSVMRFHVIPFTTSIAIPGYRKFTYYGFGYDVMSDDYKLIRITQFYGTDAEYNSQVKLYSLKSGSWRTIPNFPYRLSRRITKGVLANGALHWIVTGESNDSVAAFDLGTEEYRLIPFPKFAHDDNITFLEVAELGGCLSLMCYVNGDHVDLWVMKEYGVEESWSNLFSYGHCGAMIRPLAYSKCGRKVLLVYDGKLLTWYDLDQKSTDLQMIQMPKIQILDMCTCLQSLVLLNDGAHDLDLIVKAKQERKNKE